MTYISDKESQNLAPIALFVYNRPWHVRQTMEALQKNQLALASDLFIFSDAAKAPQVIPAVQEVREYVRTLRGFKSIIIIEREENLGLANSIIRGVTQLCNQYGKVIVLEDDLVTSPYFLKFMNDGLDVYEKIENVASIHGYVFPIDGLPETFFIKGADCWGWATWKDRWQLFEPDGAKLLEELKRDGLQKRFDFNGTYFFTRMLVDQIAGKNDSWAIRWYASAFLKNKFTLYPGRSLILNIGNDASGVHCDTTDIFTSPLHMGAVHIGPIPVEDDVMAVMKFEHFFNSQVTGIGANIRRGIRNFVRRLML